MAIEVALVLENELELRRVSGEHGRDAPGAHVEVREIAERMQDRNDAQAPEQKRQHVTEGQVVIDRTDQHQDHGDAETQAVTRGQDVHAALAEEYHARLRRVPSEHPLEEVVGLRILQHPVELHGMGTAEIRPSALSRLEARTPSCTGRNRWPATPGSTACTSSGTTLSRPSISAQARDACSSASAARGERPVAYSGERRECSTSAWR